MTMIVKHFGIPLLLSLTFLKFPFISAVQQANKTLSQNEKEKINKTQEERDNKIVGGYRCPITKYPFLVSLRNMNSQTHFCSGTLLSQFWILTALHCLVHKCHLPIRVIAGCNLAWNISNCLNNPNVQFSTISHCYLHPTSNGLRMDIALARLKNPMLKTNTVGYVKLPFSLFNDDENRKEICLISTVAGWGLQYAMNASNHPLFPPIPEYDTHLQCVRLPVISGEECDARMSKVNPSYFCTYYPLRDACLGDSGGPLICDGYQFGIVSSGHGCALNSYAGFSISQKLIKREMQQKPFELRV